MQKKLVDNWQFISILVVIALSFISQVKSYGALEQQVQSTIVENNRLMVEISDLRKEVKCANESMKEISGYLRGIGRRNFE
jgi:regulator of replication initiation timing